MERRAILWAPWRESYVKQPHSPECIFCKAVNEDDATGYVVYRSKHSFALLNKFPYNNGHVMVAPIRHVPSIELLTEEEMLDLMKVISIVLKALRICYQPHGFNVGANIGRVAGAGIEGHLHIHVVPRWNGDTNFMPVISNTKVIPEDINVSWRRIRECIKKVESA